ncbi:hypothetical protein TIFTF001_035078 [Ficus carica]|uniref:Ubiquitin-like protease family profile domain-containing protein n=1 Tax=Ficus carica TaxID=3494 RepID=A0AA88J9M7_FICCA|nr:hypothetical protein TIFTF001_035078 [Ficus carica]
MNMVMRPLAYYAHSSMRQGNQMEVPIPYTIMTFEMPVFLSFEDIYEFINLQEISANCILVYMRYLEELCRINGQAEKFAFVSPTLISPVRTDVEDAGMRDRADNLISFLRDAPKGRLYLVPHNRGRHWVLEFIDPWEDLVLYFDPLREKKHEDFTELMNIKRLNNFNNTGSLDPTLNTTLLEALRQICPEGVEPTLPPLSTPLATIRKLSSIKIKMGDIRVLTGTEGEIRSNCRRLNGDTSGGLVADY